MKKIIAVTVMGAALAAGSASVQASMTMIYSQSGDRASSGPGLNGGEFNITPISGWGANPLAGYAATAKQGSSFRSFCLEKSEFTSGANPLYAVKNSEAVGGGADTTNPGGTGDPLSYGTTWLYSQFARGVLAGFNAIQGSASRDTQAGLLQEAIWALEDESAAPVGNTFYNAAIAAFGANAKASAPLGANGVYALNITTDLAGTIRNQDMLYYAVPEPSTWFAGIGALGLLGVSAFRRSSAVKAVAAN
jgi:hypothetical protein